MKSCNIKLKFSLPRDTHKNSEKQIKLTMNYHNKLYLLSYFKPRCFGYFLGLGFYNYNNTGKFREIIKEFWKKINRKINSNPIRITHSSPSYTDK